jgi:hypothetical protein
MSSIQDWSTAILTLIAIVGVVGNIIAFLVARVELMGQRRETERLTRLTSELDHRIQRLAVGLDQRISQLERIRDLATGLTQALTILRQESQPLPAKLAAAIQIEMTKPELIALVNVSKDDSLQKLGNDIVANIEDERLPIAWNENNYKALSLDERIKFMGEVDEIRNRQYRLATDLHTRVIELIKDATNVHP